MPAICVPGRLLTRAASWKIGPPSPHNTWPAQTLHGRFLWKATCTHTHTHTHTHACIGQQRATFGFVISVVVMWWLKGLWLSQTAQSRPKNVVQGCDPCGSEDTGWKISVTGGAVRSCWFAWKSGTYKSHRSARWIFEHFFFSLFLWAEFRCITAAWGEGG